MATISIAGTFYMFNVTAANATAAATYTNNGVTYYVKKTIAGGTKLYCAAAAGSVTSGTTLTKASGTGDATITFSTVELKAHINGITTTTAGTTNYTAGDTLTMSAGETLVIDETPGVVPGPITAVATTPGTISISNTSTTTPIVVSLSTEASNLQATYLTNSLNIAGDWIVIKTGDGTASQTIDFNTAVGGVVIDYPPCVWVETGDTRHKQLTVGGSSGYFMPFFNIGAVADTATLDMLNEFYGDFDHGPVFQYDTATKIATFGKGGVVASSLGGAKIPNGARVIYPNIHITSTVYNSTWANRNEIVLGSGASANISVCAFSNRWGFGASSGVGTAGDITLTSVGFVSKFFLASTVGVLNFNNVAIGPDTVAALTSSTASFTAMNGDIYIDYLWHLTATTGTFAPALYLSQTFKIKNIGSVFVWQQNASSAGAFAWNLTNCVCPDDAPAQIGPIYATGGLIYFQFLQNLHIREIQHSSRLTAVADAVNTDYIFNCIYVLDFVIAKIRKFTNGVTPRSVLGTFDTASKQYVIKDVIYDSQNNTSYAFSLGGLNGYATNINSNNVRTFLSPTTTANKRIRYSNLTSNVTLPQTQLSMGGYHEWEVSTTSAWTIAATYDAEPFNPYWTATDKSTGQLRIGPFSDDKNMTHKTLVSGTWGTDVYISSSSLYYEGNGVEVWFTNFYPTRGITNFTGASWGATGTSATTNATIEFALRVNDGTDTSTWTSWYDATTAANWQTALASLSGYDSNKGFFARLRIVTTAALSGRLLNYARISCTPDASWTPAEIGFVPISVTGQVNNSTIALYNNTVPATPVLVKKQTITSSTTVLDLPYDFDATAKAFKIKLRKAGYGEVVSTDSSYQKGKSAPMSQVQYVVVDEVAAAAITGITVNGGANTVTITADHTIDEIYAYLQWWGMQIANMEYNIPLVTTDSINYSSTYNLTLNGGNITGTGTLSLGSNTLVVTAGETTSVPITYNSGANVYGNITIAGLVANSRVRVNNTTDNIQLYNAVVVGTSLSVPVTWTADKVLDLRVTNVNGSTAYFPYQATGTLTSSMAQFTVTQALDTVYNANAISGSTITYFSTDYPNIQVDISSGTTFTVQQLYAWFQYSIHSVNGIVFYFGGMTAQDAVNYLINISIVNLMLDNTSGHNVTMTGGYLQRSDLTSYIYASTANSIIPIYDRAYIPDSTHIKSNTDLIPALL